MLRLRACILGGFAMAMVSASHAQAPPCAPGPQEEAFMKSWAGQPGIPDHAESGPVTTRTLFACLALAKPGSSVEPACYLSYENGGRYTLRSHQGMVSPKADVVTLTCNGDQPTCCKVQITNLVSAVDAAKASAKGIRAEPTKTTGKKPSS